MHDPLNYRYLTFPRHVYRYVNYLYIYMTSNKKIKHYFTIPMETKNQKGHRVMTIGLVKVQVAAVYMDIATYA